MNPKRQTVVDDEIDLREVIQTLWKEKFKILIITLIFAVIGYIYGTNQPKVYKTTITLRDAPPVLFDKYTSYLNQLERQTSISKTFNKQFKLNLTSLDNLISFFEQNKKIDEFKSYLKKINIDPKNYFRDKFLPVTEKNTKPNQYSFTFSKPFPFKDFLSDYVVYVAENEFKNQLKINIEAEIQIFKQNLEIAKKINLEDPILRSFSLGNSVVNDPSALFYKGVKVLSQQIFYLEKLFSELETMPFKYNLILESPTTPSLVTKPVEVFIATAFALGLFLSLVFVFLRSLLLK